MPGSGQDAQVVNRLNLSLTCRKRSIVLSYIVIARLILVQDHLPGGESSSHWAATGLAMRGTSYTQGTS